MTSLEDVSRDPELRSKLYTTKSEWPVLHPFALTGLAGETVEAISPHSEADQAALLINFLVAFGNAAGRGAYFQVGADRHHLNLNAALVGETSKGRKGSSWGFIADLFKRAAPEWSDNRILNGLSSGEGLIHEVRDATTDGEGDDEIVLDYGVPDKRLLIVEGEFASTLKVMTRDGNTLSSVVRLAWDGVKLSTLTRKSPLKATEAHVSIIGHITKAELLKKLSQTDTEGGFTNRFLWIAARRSKALPFGGSWSEEQAELLARKIAEALSFAVSAGELKWGDSARPLWVLLYRKLAEGKQGLLGAATSRGEAQTVRLAALYAVLDGSRTIELTHLQAAHAVWQYAEDSAEYIFGDSTSDQVADKLVEAFKENEHGMTRTEIGNLLGRHRSKERVDIALKGLERAGRINRRMESTGGRPTERWSLI